MRDQPALDMNGVVGTHDILIVTLDCLRYDIAQEALLSGGTPALRERLPLSGWQARHSPGSFTFAALQAFFAGYLPTPVDDPQAKRLFATRFAASRSVSRHTCVFDAPDIVHGLASCGYRTICVGGVSFFNPATPLGRAFPSLFHSSHWHPAFAPGRRRSTELQVAYLAALVEQQPLDQRLFVFLNVSAIHPPNRRFLPTDQRGPVDTPASHRAALEATDAHLGRLFRLMERRAPTFCILTSDHGTAYGEDGYRGYRLGHPVVWTVPYAEIVLAPPIQSRSVAGARKA